ncbi:hypothetical protein TWF696_006819 [Orbilia brochopaga]|uniref:Heterokaryon incompatibility domain-containing protein n=1 Tax=Orbilia brochopaga TaxID=3140254 RepID=A0AAV9UQ08_9PEZI
MTISTGFPASGGVNQKGFRKWHPEELKDYIVIPVEGFANETDCIFTSHYWHEPGNPDRQGKDLQPLQQLLRDGYWNKAAYFWVDFTCLPQWERTEAEELYFRRTLKTIPRLVRDCCFTWHFLDFQPRLWVLFETAEFTRNRSRPVSHADMEPFAKHLREMKCYGVKYVLNRNGYKCTNQGDRDLVVGWLEILLILERIVPNVRTRRAILDAIDNPMVGICHHEELGITTDKKKGLIDMNERRFGIIPVPFEATGSGAHIHIKNDSDHENRLQEALKRTQSTSDDRELEDIARECDREGEYKIADITS